MKCLQNFYHSCISLFPIQVHVRFCLQKYYQLVPYFLHQLRCQPQQLHYPCFLRRCLQPLPCRDDFTNDQCSCYVSHAVTQLNNLYFTSYDNLLQFDNYFIKYDNATFIEVKNMMSVPLDLHFSLLFLLY